MKDILRWGACLFCTSRDVDIRSVPKRARGISSVTLMTGLRSDSGCCSPSASLCSGPSRKSLWSIRLSIQLRQAPSFLCTCRIHAVDCPPLTRLFPSSRTRLPHQLHHPVLKHDLASSVAPSLLICLFHSTCKQTSPPSAVAVMATMPTPSVVPPNGGQIPAGMTQAELQKIYAVSIPQFRLIPPP